MADDHNQAQSWTRRATGVALALPARRLPTIGLAEVNWQGWLARSLAREVDQRRLFPWIAVCFGCGILLFFTAEGRPSLWAPLLGTALCGGGAVLARRHLAGMAILIGLAALFAGFTAAVLRTRSVEAPAIASTTITPVSGFIEAIEQRLEGARLLVQVVDMPKVSTDSRPIRIRVTVRSAEGLAPGQYISATARLLPPPQPA